jgi:ketosteroid isomerase-like protein
LSCGEEKKIDCVYASNVVEIYMQEQEDSWNEGDLEGFMKHYWKSDSLRFIGKSGLNHGWQKTLDNYKKSYKTQEEMGTLKFTNKSMDILGEETIFVIGEWHLKRDETLEDLQGMYSLIWQKKNGTWVIITDHSS